LELAAEGSTQTANRESLHEFCSDNLQAAGFRWIPPMRIVPLMTSARSGEPLKDRQPYDVASISLKTIARHAARLSIDDRSFRFYQVSISAHGRNRDGHLSR
jgi:hypothetical protein